MKLVEQKYLVKKLQEARALIENRTNWTRGTLARDAWRHEVAVTSVAACKFCASGAVIRAMNLSNDVPLVSTMLNTLAESFDGNIPLENDNGTHLQVLMAYDFAILQAKDDFKAMKAGNV